jgi:hypothetical protein
MKIQHVESHGVDADGRREVTGRSSGPGQRPITGSLNKVMNVRLP